MFRRDFPSMSVLVLAVTLSAGASAFADRALKLAPAGNPPLFASPFLGAPTPTFARGTLRMNLHREMILQGKSLQAGNYTLRWESHSPTATVTVSQRNYVRATATAKIVERSQKYNRDALVFETHPNGTNTIREIRLGGSSLAIVFYE